MRAILWAMVWSVASAAAGAQPMQHGAMHPAAVPVETGQAAFAAMAEIVAILDADPATDWSKVDLDALREHLVDMDAVVMSARAQVREVEGGILIEISGPGRTGEAIRRLVPAHASELGRLPGWRAEATVTKTGVELQVIGADPATTARIRGLGFYGVLTTGAHHRPHHLAIARGARPH